MESINNTDNMKIKQKYLGDKGFIIFIAFLSAFVPLSTDIYLPALPSMVDYFNTTPSMVNSTLALFFVFYALGTLLWGPLSDKYGRKPILIIGMIIYTIGSVLCMFSTNIFELIIFRVIQSIGCGAATAVATAIVKDSYSGRKRMTTIALVQSMGMLSPVVSPMIGAIILSVLSWRGVFFVLTFIGILSLIGCIAMQETIEYKNPEGVFKSIGRIGIVIKNKSFTLLLLTFTFIATASMSFITASSYIYIDDFGVSEKVYSYFFAANALFFLIGPLLYIKLSKHYTDKLIIKLSYTIITISGLLISSIGSSNPIIFTLSLMPASLFISLINPARVNLIIEQLEGDTGSASSLISCASTIFGSTGMFIISMDFSNRIRVMGIMYALIGAASLVAWLILSKKPYIKHVTYHHAEA